MFHRTRENLRRRNMRLATAAQHQQQLLQQQMPLWQRLEGLGPPPGARPLRLAPVRLPPPVIEGGHGQSPAERWAQVPLGVQLMDEICDASSGGSDFAFWSKSHGSLL